MQPPPPRKPEARPTLGQTSHGRPEPTRHPQSPPDVMLTGPGGSGAHVVGTRDHGLIRAWAAHHGAEPATGQATESGPATVDVNDQGSGIRFNFPAAARFRPVSWEEWLAHFDRDQLVFVYEVGLGTPGRTPAGFGGAFYRLVPGDTWADRPLATEER